MASNGSGPVIRLALSNAPEVLRAFKVMPKVANDEMRVASKEIAGALALHIASAGRSQGRQAALLAKTVHARKDRVPSVVIGGSSAIGHAWPKRGRGKAFELVFGSEFGGAGHGFLSHTGRQGTWIFPAVRADQPMIDEKWNAAAERIISKFTFGG